MKTKKPRGKHFGTDNQEASTLIGAQQMSFSEESRSSPLPSPSEPSSPLELVVECVFVPAIGAILTAAERFSARCEIDLSWAATPKDRAGFEADPINYLPEFFPKVLAVNCNDIEGVPVARACGGNYEVRGGSNQVRLRFDGDFSKKFEVEDFPFDFQDLTMIFTLAHSDATVAAYNPSLRANNFIVHTRFLALPEFQVNSVHLSETVLDDFSHLFATVRISRHARSYVLSLFMPTALMGAISFAAFLIEDYFDRLTAEVTLLIAMVSLLLVGGDRTDSGASVTILDRYMYATFAFITVVISAFAVVEFFRKVEWDADACDRVCLYTCVAVFVIIQLDICFRWIRARSRNYQSDNEDDHRVLEYFFTNEAFSCTGKSIASGSIRLKDRE